MHEVALDLLILLAGIWLIAVTLRPAPSPVSTKRLPKQARDPSVILE